MTDAADHTHEFHWYLDEKHDAAACEAGWQCCSCGHRPGDPPGFSPEHDRKLIDHKVMAVLMDLDNSGVVRVGNGSAGDWLESTVATRCRTEKRFDQYSIALFILEAMTPGHAKFWAETSEAILAGNDPRRRCHCGALSTSSTLVDGDWVGRCSAHVRELW